MQKIIYTINDLPHIAQSVINSVTNRAIALYGPMGSGKTTLIKALVKELGGADGVSSPTFGLVHEYLYPNGDLLGYHFDFYRLNNETEALDMGLEEYFNQDVWFFMEWPEKIGNLLPENCSKLHIRVLDEHTRELKLQN
jgi:tRNA threonylcarbamoyladenosine biosynthesis protein TsaE